MKNIAKHSVFFFAGIGGLGAIIAIASVLNCGTICDFAAAQAKNATVALIQAHNEQAAEVSATTVQ